MSENPLIDAKRAEIAEIDAEIAELTNKRNMAHAMLEGMMMMVSDTETDGPEEERRMRLGAKKRVVYTLVASGFETLKELNFAVKGYDIDSRYIRDVIRKAIKCGDILGDIDDRFIMSDSGKEILAKAPMPKDWTEVYNMLALRAPPPRGAILPPAPKRQIDSSVWSKAVEHSAAQERREQGADLHRHLNKDWK